MSKKRVFFASLIFYATYLVVFVRYNFIYFSEHGFNIGIFILPIFYVFNFPLQLALNIGIPEESLVNCNWLYCTNTLLGWILVLLVNILLLVLIFKIADQIIKLTKNIK